MALFIFDCGEDGLLLASLFNQFRLSLVILYWALGCMISTRTGQEFSEICFLLQGVCNPLGGLGVRPPPIKALYKEFLSIGILFYVGKIRDNEF